MTDCIELAARLGKAIADSPQAAGLRTAREAMSAEPEIVEALGQYQDQAEKIARLEAETKPVEPEDKVKLQQINDTLIGSAVFKQFTAAQVEYVDLMRKVNGAIQQELAETER